MQKLARGFHASSFLVSMSVVFGASAAGALEGRFDRPLYKDRITRLDNCETFGSSCGQPAADHYCRIRGYESASRFETERATPTRVINFGQQCKGPGCVAFRSVVCFTSAQRPGHGLDWPHIIDR
jgi:hypothetical protein